METVEQLKKTYAGMNDEELEAVASDAYDLTKEAQQALQHEISKRGLQIELRISPPRPELKNPELDLVIVDCVGSLEEARKIKELLITTGISSYFGHDYIEDLDSFRGSFDYGVDVRVSSSAEANAFALIQDARKNDPQLSPDDSDDDDDSDEDETSASSADGQFVHCPKCHSEQIVFEGLAEEPGTEAESAEKYNWHCDECGHDWQDDGLEES